MESGLLAEKGRSKVCHSVSKKRAFLTNRSITIIGCEYVAVEYTLAVNSAALVGGGGLNICLEGNPASLYPAKIQMAL